MTNTELENEISRLAQIVDSEVISTPIYLMTIADELQVQAYPQVYFIADRAYEITSIREVHDTLQTSADGASIQITKLTGTDVPGASELNLITDTAYSGSSRTDKGFNLKGIAVNVVTNGTLTNKVSSLTLAAGDRLVWGGNGTLASTFISLTTVLKKI